MSYCKAMIVFQYMSGMTYSEIQKENGFKSQTTVQRVVESSEIDRRNRGWRRGRKRAVNHGTKMRQDSSIDRDEYVRVRNSEGASDSQIARELGITQSSVSKRRRKLGVNPAVPSNTYRHNCFIDRFIGSSVLLTNGSATVVSCEGNNAKECNTTLECNFCGCRFTRRGARFNGKSAIKCPDCSKNDKFFSHDFKQCSFVFPSEKKESTIDLDEVRHCKECGAEFTERMWRDLLPDGKKAGRRHECCSEKCKSINDSRKRKEVGTIHWSIVAKHYGTTRCYLCGKPVNSKDFKINGNGAFIAGPTYPSTDHVVAIANGGDGSIGNSRLAHCMCNSLKSSTPIEDYLEVVA